MHERAEAERTQRRKNPQEAHVRMRRSLATMAKLAKVGDKFPSVTVFEGTPKGSSLA